jgi:hypothetical protein
MPDAERSHTPEEFLKHREHAHGVSVGINILRLTVVDLPVKEPPERPATEEPVPDPLPSAAPEI